MQDKGCGEAKLSLSGPCIKISEHLIDSKSTSNVKFLCAVNCRQLAHLSSSDVMASKSAYQTTFEAQRVIQPIYTGGSVALDKTGRILATCLGEDALLTDLNTGKQLARIEGVCLQWFSFCPPGLMLVLGWRTHFDTQP